MRTTIALLLCTGALAGCGTIPPPVWQTYDNYLYGPGNWVPNTYYGYNGSYGYSGGYGYGGYNPPGPATIWGADPPPAAVITDQRRTTGMVNYGGRFCQMDYFSTSYSNGNVVNTTSIPYNCTAQPMPMRPAS